DRVHLVVARDIARQHEGIGQRCRELSHVLFETLALEGDGQRCARVSGRLRNCPRERSLVGDTNNEPDFAGQRGRRHGRRRRLPGAFTAAMTVGAAALAGASWPMAVTAAALIESTAIVAVAVLRL